VYTRQGVKQYAIPGAGGIGEKRMVEQGGSSIEEDLQYIECYSRCEQRTFKQ
jgi:hypothetical protein